MNPPDCSAIEPRYVTARHCARLASCSNDKIISLAVQKLIRSYPVPSMTGKRWMWRFKEDEFLADWDKLSQAALSTLPNPIGRSVIG